MIEEKPEADAIEQRIPAEPSALGDAAGDPPVEAPEGDYAEQHTPALPVEGVALPRMDAEASEADLLEQAEDLPGSDDDYRPGDGEYPAGAEGEDYPSTDADEAPGEYLGQ